MRSVMHYMFPVYFSTFLPGIMPHIEKEGLDANVK